jgi:hypothetical protein
VKKRERKPVLCLREGEEKGEEARPTEERAGKEEEGGGSEGRGGGDEDPPGLQRQQG